MKKENIFSKLNIKDYNNELENILAKKDFSVDTKNLLLNMAYKIENAYKDYLKIKQEVLTKNDYMEKILKIVDDKCYEFITIKPSMPEFEEYKDNKYTIDREKGKIIVIQNEYYALKALLELPKVKWCILNDYGLLKDPLCALLSSGSIMHETEVLRDFDGWAWNISINNIDNISINLIYQNLVYLIGNDFLIKWIENTQGMVDYVALLHLNLENKYTKEFSDKVLNLISKLAMETNMSKQIIEKKNYLYEELKLFENREEYLANITKSKKENMAKIDRIDKIVNNKELLQEEYIKRNSVLENEEKIFSIKRLKIILEEERQNCLDEIKALNDMIDPKKYVNKKTILERDYNFLNDLNVSGIDEKKKIELCKCTLKAFEVRVDIAQTREELLNLVYEIRYYRYIQFNETKKLKEIKELYISFYKAMIKLIKKLIDFKWAETISLSKALNLRVLIKIFDSKIIDLENIIIETEHIDEKIVIQYYDSNVLENQFEINIGNIEKSIILKKLKLKKKIKVFN